jgi:Protein of unknown function, DUF547
MLTRFETAIHTSVLATLLLSLSVPAAQAGCILKFGAPEDSLSLMSFDDVNHADYHALLRHYVDEQGRVCYSDWTDHCGDVRRLGAYLHQLAQVDSSRPASYEATLAYYVNAYNALTLWGILDSYPVVSIQQLDGEKSRYAIFDDLRLWVGDRYLSLNGIENDVLRPLGDPRIHFALVCAARGCPRLRNEAYTARCVDQQLTDNAIEFFSDRTRFHISKLSGKVRISPILKWYRGDFGATDYQVVSTVFRYLPADDRCWLATNPGWRLVHLGYDWGLNDGCPTFFIASGKVGYSAYAKISPMIAPLMPPKEEGNSSAHATCSVAARQNLSTSVDGLGQPSSSPPPVEPIGPPIPGDDSFLYQPDTETDAAGRLVLESPPVPPAPPAPPIPPSSR